MKSLKQIILKGYLGIGIPQQSTPVQEFSLAPIYPNPFNALATIDFKLEIPGWIDLEVFNNQGQSVAKIAEGNFTRGKHTRTWNATSFNSRIYFIRLKTEKRLALRRCLLLK